MAVDANYRASVSDGSGKVTFELGELAADANVTDPVSPVIGEKTYLNAQRVSVYARNIVHLSIPVSIKKVDMVRTSTLLSDAVFSLYDEDAVDAQENLKGDAEPIQTGITTLKDDNL